MQKVDLRIITMDVPVQKVITKDNVTVKVNAVLYFKVEDPEAVVVRVLDFIRATSQIAQTTLRNVAGQFQAAERLAEAGKVLAEVPTTMQLRFLKTLSEIATEKNSTIIFPVPIDLLSTFMGSARDPAAARATVAPRTVPVNGTAVTAALMPAAVPDATPTRSAPAPAPSEGC